MPGGLLFYFQNLAKFNSTLNLGQKEVSFRKSNLKAEGCAEFPRCQSREYLPKAQFFSDQTDSPTERVDILIIIPISRGDL